MKDGCDCFGRGSSWRNCYTWGQILNFRNCYILKQRMVVMYSTFLSQEKHVVLDIHTL